MKSADEKSSLESLSEILVCPVCGSGLVYPLERCRMHYGKWRVLLTCPECFSGRILSVTGKQIDFITGQVEGALTEIAAALAQAEQRHMREECYKFIRALNDGNIEPLDF